MWEETVGREGRGVMCMYLSWRSFEVGEGGVAVPRRAAPSRPRTASPFALPSHGVADRLPTELRRGLPRPPHLASALPALHATILHLPGRVTVSELFSNLNVGDWRIKVQTCKHPRRQLRVPSPLPLLVPPRPSPPFARAESRASPRRGEGRTSSTRLKVFK